MSISAYHFDSLPFPEIQKAEGGKEVNPDELALISDSGERARITHTQLEV